MPYIENKKRKQLDPLLDYLIREIKSMCKTTTDFAGILNYVITRIGIGILPTRKYWALELLHGVYIGAAREFARRVLNPYEETMIQKNGDIENYG